MDAFLENSLFFLLDDAEPILPIFQSREYVDPGRIVEVTDVGCDTETTYPIHLPRNGFHRRRGGAESYGSTRRIAEWRNERPNKFSPAIATILNNNKDRGGNYIEGKARRIDRDYDDVYIADLDYDSDPENFCDDFELSRDDSAIEYKDDYYNTRFVNPRNIIGHSNRKKLLQDIRYDYMRDSESPFVSSNRAHKRENTFPQQWFTERNFHKDANVRSRRSSSSERKKRTKILSRMNDNFNCETEFGKAHGMAMRRERDDFPNAVNSEDNFWDSVSLEKDASYEGLTDSTKLRNRDDLQPKMSYNFIDSEREEEKTRRENNREHLSSNISTKSAKYQTSKSNAIKEKPKILQSNALSANFPMKSAKIPIDGRTSSMNSAGKDSKNVRPRSAVEGKKGGINSPFERTKTMNANIDDIYRINKHSNETRQPARTFKRIADSNSNKQIYTTNESDTNPRSRNNINWINTVSHTRSTIEEKNEKTFTLRMTNASPCTGVEKEKRKFFSRLPVRTWKRLRTREPATLRLDSNITNGDDNRKLQAVDIATTNLNDHLEKIKNDKVHEEIRPVYATADRSDIKQSSRFATGLLDKPKITSSSVKDVKGPKGLSTKETSKRRKKKMDIK